jgi:RNA polymerase sigma-70 factor (ECF subfamily)
MPQRSDPEVIDECHYRDDILRLLFVCGTDPPATQQIALALRIVSGLTGSRLLEHSGVSAAMEQRSREPSGPSRSASRRRAPPTGARDSRRSRR